MSHRDTCDATVPWHSARHLYWILALTLLSVTLLRNYGFAQAEKPSSPLAVPYTGTTPLKVIDGSAKMVSHYTPDQKLRLAFALKPPHLDEERQVIDQLHNKKSPQFHHWLTAAQWNARFAPSAQDEQAVVDWATSQGLTVTQRYPNHLLVDVEGPSSTIEAALNIRINNYQLGNRSFFSNDREPQLPAGLSTVVWSVLGLNSLEHERPASKTVVAPSRPDYVFGPAAAIGPSDHASANPAKLPPALKQLQQSRKNGPIPDMTNGIYDPTDIYDSNAYDFNALYGQGHCCNPLSNPGSSPPETSIAIATFMAQDLSDIAGFHAQYPYLAYNIQLYDIDGSPAPGDGEGTMDAEWSTAMSNSFGSYIDTSKVYVYQGANYLNVTITDVYNHMLTDGYARVFSTSWYCTEGAIYGPGEDCSAGTMNARDAIFLSMVGQGWTLVAASGDAGATSGCQAADAVQYPSTDPNVVAAGGTTLSLFSGPIFNYEVAWTGGPDGCFSNDGGSTGGFSSYWGTPSYQAYLGFGSRAVPDIALNADWYNTPQNVYFGGVLSGNGGTSIVAPELAGFFAQENAYLLSLGNICGGGFSPCAPMGNANYYLYDEGRFNSAAHNPFYDITSGCNNNDITAFYGLGYYCAGPGYDEVTGWGSANMLQLAWSINWFSAAAIGSPSVAFSGPAVSTWYNTDQTVTWTVNDNGGGYPPTGVAGFTQGWDSIPSDPTSEPTPGSGNSFYSGPQFKNINSGSLDFTGSGVSQGCHYVHVEGWNNMGFTSGDSVYGPLCYDITPPVTSAFLSGSLSGGVYISPVKVTLSASDSYSGVASTVYQINGGAVQTYSAPFTISTRGSYTITFHSTDVAGNVEATKSVSFTIESATATSLTTSVNPSRYLQAVTFTAKVTSAAPGTITNTVSFKDGATTLATVAVTSGIATYTTSALATGVHSMTASYKGNGSFAPSTSAALNQTVAGKASVALASSLNPSTYGKVVSFTATVSASPGPVPTGTVTFKDVTKSVTLGTKSLVAGKAIFTTTATQLVPGAHNITATYNGDTLHSAGAVGSLAQTVNKAATTTAVKSSLNPSTHGTSVTFTANVKSAVAGALTGTATFKNGGVPWATVAVSSTGVATYTTSALTVGSHSITVSYTGNANFAASTSPVLTQVVK